MEGRRQLGRQKKTWSKVVEEDMRKLNIMEDKAEVENSGGNSYHVQPQAFALSLRYSYFTVTYVVKSRVHHAFRLLAIK